MDYNNNLTDAILGQKADSHRDPLEVARKEETHHFAKDAFQLLYPEAVDYSYTGPKKKRGNFKYRGQIVQAQSAKQTWQKNVNGQLVDCIAIERTSMSGYSNETRRLARLHYRANNAIIAARTSTGWRAYTEDQLLHFSFADGEVDVDNKLLIFIPLSIGKLL
jgi:hypothetical protein